MTRGGSEHRKVHGRPWRLAGGAALLALVAPALAAASTDPDPLWFRYEPLAAAERFVGDLTGVFVDGAPSPTRSLVAEELRRGLTGLLGRPTPVVETRHGDGRVLVLTDPSSPLLERLGWRDEVQALGTGGFLVRAARVDGRSATVVASASEVGALYGSFHLLRSLQDGAVPGEIDVAESPRVSRRLLNHWDNLDGTVERGYAGSSLWNWEELPSIVDPRLREYARATASLGLNGMVPNNVNADPRILERATLLDVAALAEVFRPWGIRVYLSVNFASPTVIGGLETADPAAPEVAAWWRSRADEIYRLIPDFGGFLVKANSEGQPGPRDFGRSHADGANVLAAALEPHGGVVFYRAFVYDPEIHPDRIQRSTLELLPLDGEFRENVFVQAKNGPLDFQPREPFHPLFGRLEETPVAAELQITQEYFGHSTHLVYLGTVWEEFFSSDTFAEGPGSSVARIVDGTLFGHDESAIAGVANTGSDTNWTGHPLAQANWYAFGRFAWDPEASAATLAEEWIRQTWSRDPEVVETIRELMMDSRETYVRYTMPLGLHHLIGGDHYAPMPENPDPRREDWSAIYYHRADPTGIGVDRSPGGNGGVTQYHPPLRELWGDPATCPEDLLLWFHRLPWDHRMGSGRTLWEELVATYRRGAAEASRLPDRWRRLEGRVDPERWADVLALLERQAAEAADWSEHCIDYFRGRKDAPNAP